MTQTSAQSEKKKNAADPPSAPSFHLSSHTNVHRHNKTPYTHMHHSFLSSNENTNIDGAAADSNTHTLASFHSHTPLAVFHCKNKHTLTHSSLYGGQLLSESVDLLVHGNNRGADGKAAECLAAAAEGNPSMALTASSLTHTHCPPPFPSTPPSPQQLDHACPFSSQEEEGEEARGLIFPRREHSIVR